MRRKTVALFVLFMQFAGVASARADVPAEKLPSRKGVVFVLDGVGGHDILGIKSQLFLPQAGVHHEIRSFAWSHGFGQFMKDLQDIRHLVRKADELAVLILAEKNADPQRPVYILAQSGGTGLALLAAERLPAQTLERLVLLAAAVSPEYDLRSALRAVRGQIVNHHSCMDRLILHWGTWQFGTADRHYVASAGCTGFVVPKAMSPEDCQLYKRLVQIPWEPRMMLHGHHGGHTGAHSPAFLMIEVAPWLRD